MFNRVLYALGIVGIVALGAVISWNLWGVNRGVESDSTADWDSETETTLVTLPDRKLASAGIEIASADQSTIQPTRTISGRLDYDQDRHVSIKAACDGILTEIRVRPGDQVRSGQVVAIASSPELGVARSNVLKRLAELKLADTQYRWRKDLCDGVEELVDLIRQQTSPREIEERLHNESLGEYREKLVTAYTRSRLASKLAASSRDAASSGAISGRIQQQRESEQQVSEAAVAAVLEQSFFEAKQACKAAEATLDDARRQLDVSMHELNTLLGPAAEKVTADQIASQQSTALSEFQLVSPIDGTVEERLLSATERVSVGDPVFTIADTTQLWAIADIRERDWAAINVASGQEVTITTPAIPEETYLGRVLFVGRRLEPSTGAAPLVAALKSSDKRLRPGMFIRMTVPAGAPHTAVVVPETAVVVHEQRAFVFVPESERDFRRVDVEVGTTEEGLTEITSGLKATEKVAVSGVFKLKSELLLTSEEE